MLKIRITALFILVASFLVGWFLYTSQISENDRFHFKLGLDLNGGTHLTYRAKTEGLNSSDIEDSMNALRRTIERRINIFGVSEPIVQIEKGGVLSGQEDAYRLIVELPGVTDVSEAIAQIGRTPSLEFMLPKDLDDSAEIKLDENSGDLSTTVRNLYIPTGLTGAQLKRTSVIFDNVSRQPTIQLNYNDDGIRLLSDVTSNNIGKVMAIFLDGELISAPVIRDSITNGQAIISGNFTPEEARDLSRNLNFGALPVPIELIETQTIGATLGEETLFAGIRAMLIGFSVIFLFMLIWYRLPGFISMISLVIYAILMLALFKLIPVTLTSAGLAGFILSIGMAIDANVLIIERMKEELRKGLNLYDAVKIGSDRAWSSIRDGNLTSIISAIVLYWMSGSSIVQGFSLVFGIGVVVSMFSALFCSKIILLAISSKKVMSEATILSKMFNSGFKINIK